MEHNAHPLKRFFNLLKPERKDIFYIYLYAIFNGLINLSLPLGIQAIINLITGGQLSTSWTVLVLFVMIGIAMTGGLQIFQLTITERLQQRIFTRASFEFAYRIPRIKMESVYKYYVPELVNRFFDTLSVQKGLSKILIDFSTATLQIIFGLILLEELQLILVQVHQLQLKLQLIPMQLQLKLQMQMETTITRCMQEVLILPYGQ